MDNLSKLYTDIHRTIKHDRAQHAGEHDGLRASNAVAQLFEKKTAGLGEIPCAITEHWLNTYIKPSKNIAQEPGETNIDWLVKVFSLLNGTFDTDMDFPQSDWKKIADIIKLEAEDLPLDILSDIMAVFVNRRIL
ncbi:MAG TPA: hypothetical protein VFC68_01920 [Treponemataceae bacterium]|nr:hypothetical protein [Treponemataceae bacterium]